MDIGKLKELAEKVREAATRSQGYRIKIEALDRERDELQTAWTEADKIERVARSELSNFAAGRASNNGPFG
jgi:hypothetical protein